MSKPNPTITDLIDKLDEVALEFRKNGDEFSKAIRRVDCKDASVRKTLNTLEKEYANRVDNLLDVRLIAMSIRDQKEQ